MLKVGIFFLKKKLWSLSGDFRQILFVILKGTQQALYEKYKAPKLGLHLLML